MPPTDVPHFAVSIDPGVTGTGYAIWLRSIPGRKNPDGSLSQKYWEQHRAPARWGTIRPPRMTAAGSSAVRWVRRAEWLAAELKSILDEFTANECGRAAFTEAYVEEPAFFQSAGGTVVAESGQLVKLCMATGVLLGACFDQGMFVTLVPVLRWKGQLPKETAQRRVIGLLAACPDAWEESLSPEMRTARQRLLLGQYPDHVYDAIGIGFHAKGIAL